MKEITLESAKLIIDIKDVSMTRETLQIKSDNSNLVCTKSGPLILSFHISNKPFVITHEEELSTTIKATNPNFKSVDLDETCITIKSELLKDEYGRTMIVSMIKPTLFQKIKKMFCRKKRKRDE